MARGRWAMAAGVMTLSLASMVPPAPAQRASMTLREKVGQLVMFGIDGTRLSGVERDAIGRQRLAGVILFRHNYSDRAQLAGLTRQIASVVRKATGTRPLISADQEGGVVKRFPDLPPWYSAPEIGERGRRLALEQGRATGRELSGVGVNVNLAPVADLDLPPGHVMRSRSFGRDPDRVGRIARAFTEGMQQGGVAATAKHFPGLGGATINTDYGRAYVRRTKWQLRNIDAQPFRAVMNGDIRLVMVSHAIYPNDGGNRPASLNPFIVRRRLRDGFGYEGVAISDALGAVAWRFDGSVPSACVATIKAGVDIALVTGNVRQGATCAAAVRRAVRDGTIPRQRIDNAVERVLALKAWLGR